MGHSFFCVWGEGEGKNFVWRVEMWRIFCEGWFGWNGARSGKK